MAVLLGNNGNNNLFGTIGSDTITGGVATTICLVATGLMSLTEERVTILSLVAAMMTASQEVPAVM